MEKIFKIPKDYPMGKDGDMKRCTHCKELHYTINITTGLCPPCKLKKDTGAIRREKIANIEVTIMLIIKYMPSVCIYMFIVYKVMMYLLFG